MSEIDKIANYGKEEIKVDNPLADSKPAATTADTMAALQALLTKVSIAPGANAATHTAATAAGISAAQKQQKHAPVDAYNGFTSGYPGYGSSSSSSIDEPVLRRPAVRGPDALIKHHLSSQLAADNFAKQKIEVDPLATKENQVFPPPHVKAKAWYCSCFTNCHDADSKLKCPCRKNKEPCDQEKCHKRPKGVWLAWGNGDQCDCRRLGTNEEERKFGVPKDRMRNWVKGSGFLP